LEEVFLYQDSDKQRYSRATILVVGVGALGCQAAALLAAAGVGRLLLVDDDSIDSSNLQRQLLFDDDQIGRSKVSAARESLIALAGGGRVDAVETRLETSNATELISQCDFVIDGCDDPRTKLLINATAVATSTPFVYAGVARGAGETMAVAPGASACLACVFPELHVDIDGDEARACSELGILAPIAGVIASLQALAALGALCGDARFKPGLMRSYNLRGRRWRHIDFPRDPACRVCGPAAVTSATDTGRLQPCPS